MSPVARVAVEKTTCRFDKLFDYAVPEGMALCPGIRVMVPFGKGQRRVGLVVELAEAAEVPGELKPVAAVLEEERPDYPAEDLPLTILYEDAYLLAVDKPQGMLIHPSSARNTGTLANAVAGYYRRTGSTGAFHPLTRLDRDTFGIVLIAKNGYACALLQRSRPRKTYHALTLGGPKDDWGTIDAPIARKPLPSLLREIRPDGKPSRTEYRVLDRGEALCRLALTPITGRTHQLRLHCAYMGFPILGDPQYGSPESLTYSEGLGLSSQALCAKSLRFTHPITGEELVLESNMEV